MAAPVRLACTQLQYLPEKNQHYNHGSSLKIGRHLPGHVAEGGRKICPVQRQRRAVTVATPTPIPISVNMFGRGLQWIVRPMPHGFSLFWQAGCVCGEVGHIFCSGRTNPLQTHPHMFYADWDRSGCRLLLLQPSSRLRLPPGIISCSCPATWPGRCLPILEAAAVIIVAGFFLGQITEFCVPQSGYRSCHKRLFSVWRLNRLGSSGAMGQEEEYPAGTRCPQRQTSASVRVKKSSGDGGGC